MVGHLFAGGWKGIRRKFGKVAFYMESGNHPKKDAQQIANYLRKKGYKVRIVKARRGYEVYTNPVCSIRGYRQF